LTISIEVLADHVRAAREDAKVSQEQLAKRLASAGVNRSHISHLEQARRIPPVDALEAICGSLGIPHKYWEPFTKEDYRRRLEFEEGLSELTGYPVTLRFLDTHASVVAEAFVAHLFNVPRNVEQALDALNSTLVFYRVRPMTMEFFKLYFGVESMKSPDGFNQGVQRFQKEAIRLFSTFQEAYACLNRVGELEANRRPLLMRDVTAYHNREPWNEIEEVPEERLPDLGYISAQEAQRERTEREAVADFLRELSGRVAQSGKGAIESYGGKKRRKMSSMLRQFKSHLPHDFLSPLFVPDADALRREADSLAPKGDDDLQRIGATQQQAQRNLARYLAADHLDIYVATSMRVDADFVSVNRFVKSLFAHADVRPLNLRYFNPTQSWIDDRVAKGLVEALMLRRATLTIYMAQKSDTFGKDSEASVALGQGKPVVVFVPKLVVASQGIDSAAIGSLPKEALERLVSDEGDSDDRDLDPTMDTNALLSRLLTLRLQRINGDLFAAIVREHWADFDLYGEDLRIDDTALRERYRKYLDAVIRQKRDEALPDDLRAHLIGILVAVAVRFEGRAKLFRDTHPLALQVIASTGVLNGILVARSVDACAKLIEALIKNVLEFELRPDSQNYRLVEKTTQSTARVISRHALITSAFATYYSRDPHSNDAG
jgi:transcriptional regulator with XRE-family HTH domain